MGLYLGKFRVGVEIPTPTSVVKHQGFEVRHYPACVVAQTVSEGDPNQGRQGFRALANYIGAFGEAKNDGGQKVAMTAPVVTETPPKAKGEKIAMTAPVVTSEASASAEDNSSQYVMQFIMPSTYSLASLPRPTDPAVKLKEVPPRTLAVLQFAWRTNPDIVLKKETELLTAIEADKAVDVVEGAKPQLARYNDPFTPGFLRTNEIWVDVTTTTATTTESDQA